MPKSAQPPDPCALLSAADVSAALGVSLVPAGPKPQSDLATADDPQRVCFWSSQSGMFSLIIHTQPAEDVRASTQHQATITMRELFDDSRGVPVRGIGDDAKLFHAPYGTILDVVSGARLLSFSTTDFPTAVADPAVERLAGLVVGRLPQ